MRNAKLYLTLTMALGLGLALLATRGTVASPGIVTGTVLLEDFEGAFDWTVAGNSTDNTWQVITGTHQLYGPVEAGCPREAPNDVNPDLVSLDPRELDAEGKAYLAPAFEGQAALWFGNVATDTVEVASYLDEDAFLDFSRSECLDGGTSAGVYTGTVTSGPITVTAGLAAPGLKLTLAGWWEIESVFPSEYDQMNVWVKTAKTEAEGMGSVMARALPRGQVFVTQMVTDEDSQAGWVKLDTLNPDEDPPGGRDNAPYGYASVSGKGGIPEWGEYEFDLTPYVYPGQDNALQLRFEFHTVDERYNAFRGWMIDDVALLGPIACGYVWDCDTGKPVEGATVSLEGTEFSRLSDSDGLYAIFAPEGMPDGYYNLKAEAEGYAARYYDTDPGTEGIQPPLIDAPGQQLNFVGLNCLGQDSASTPTATPTNTPTATTTPGTPTPTATSTPTTTLPSTLYLPFIMKNYEGWQTGFHVQNLGEDPAHVTVTYFKPWGIGAHMEYATPEPGKAATFYQPAAPDSSLPDGCYSAIVQADQPISAIANQTNYPDGIADSYDAPYVATQVYLPLVYRGHSNWYTTFAVQNADTSRAEATVEFYSEGGSTPMFTTTTSISAAGVSWFEMNQERYDVLGAPWLGSVVISSTQKLAVVANHIKLDWTGAARSEDDNDSLAEGIGETEGTMTAGSAHVMFSTPGWTDGVRELIAPLVFKNYNPNDGSGWTTGIQVQNMAGETAYVTVTFNRTNGSGSWNVTKSVEPSSFVNFYMPDLDYVPDGSFGSAVISSTEPVAAVVSHTKYVSDMASGYNALPKDSASSRISLPLWFKHYSPNDGSGWTSGILVMNLGEEPISIKLTLDHVNGVDSWERWAFDVEPGFSGLFYLPEFAYVPDGSFGSAVASNPYHEQPIAAIVNHTKYGASVVSSYRGINY